MLVTPEIFATKSSVSYAVDGTFWKETPLNDVLPVMLCFVASSILSTWS